MGDYGIKVAKPGFSVHDAPLSKLIIHSDYPVLKIRNLFTGSITYTKDSAAFDTLLATHDLGYIPVLRTLSQWWNIDSGAKETSFRRAPIFDSLVGGSVSFSCRPYATATEIRFSVGSFDGTGATIVSLDFVMAVYYDQDEDV